MNRTARRLGFAVAAGIALLLANPSHAVGGVDHVGLTVSDLEASTTFFTNLLGFKEVGGDPSYPARFVSNGEILVTLWQAGEGPIAFDRKQNVGLHHLAFKVESFDALDELYQRCKEAPSVKIEFAPELSYGGPAKHMMLREPSGNRLEFIHRPKAE